MLPFPLSNSLWKGKLQTRASLRIHTPAGYCFDMYLSKTSRCCRQRDTWLRCLGRGSRHGGGGDRGGRAAAVVGLVQELQPQPITPTISVLGVICQFIQTRDRESRGQTLVTNACPWPCSISPGGSSLSRPRDLEAWVLRFAFYPRLSRGRKALVHASLSKCASQQKCRTRRDGIRAPRPSHLREGLRSSLPPDRRSRKTRSSSAWSCCRRCWWFGTRS